MKLPDLPYLVPRAIMDDLRAELRELREERRRLVRVIVRMKVAGGSIPLVRQSVQLQPRAVDPLLQLIDDNPHAQRNQAVRRQLVSYLDRERAKGTDDTHIERVLATWSKIDRHTDDETIALVTAG